MKSPLHFTTATTITLAGAKTSARTGPGFEMPGMMGMEW